jgi:hypothetical protein
MEWRPGQGWMSSFFPLSARDCRGGLNWHHYSTAFQFQTAQKETQNGACSRREGLLIIHEKWTGGAFYKRSKRNDYNKIRRRIRNWILPSSRRSADGLAGSWVPWLPVFHPRNNKKITNIDMIKNNTTAHRHGNLFVFLIMRDDAVIAAWKQIFYSPWRVSYFTVGYSILQQSYTAALRNLREPRFQKKWKGRENIFGCLVLCVDEIMILI